MKPASRLWTTGAYGTILNFPLIVTQVTLIASLAGIIAYGDIQVMQVSHQRGFLIVVVNLSAIQ